MAILKMKKLRLMAVRSRKEELLKELVRRGCVEFSEMEADESLAGILTSESSEMMALKSKHASLVHAVELLSKYAPAKSKLLSAKPEVDGEVLLDDSGIEESLRLAEAIEEGDEKIKKIVAEESRLRSLMESLTPWLGLDMPLETEGTQRSCVLMGSFSSKVPLSDVESALREATEEAELFRVSQDKSSHYVLLVCIREALPAVQEKLRSFGFTAAALSGMKGTAKECALEAGETLKSLAAEKEACAAAIAAEAPRRDELKLAADKVSTAMAMADAEEKLCGTGSVVVMEGWMPEEKQEELEKVFESFECAWESLDPEEDEYPKVPVELKNNVFTNSLNMVTNMYSLPAYGTVDPNPLMAPFFILFYGLMMADMGYGIIMMLAAIVAMKKIKPRAGTLAFCQLLLYGGISTFLMGALTGGLFGDAPYRIVHMINPNSTWQGLPYLFSPVNDSNLVLYGSMVLGLIHLNAGMVVSFIQKKKSGNIMDGIFEEGPLWVIILGGVMMGLKLLGLTDVLFTPGLVVLCIGVVMLLYGAGRHSKGFGKVTAAFGLIYNTLTGWFGDILSYSRIMALMLAGGVVAQVFNTIAAMPAESMGVNVVSILAFLIIFLIGHVLNFGLNLLGCFVHDLRLQCLEFFGKFYVDGGKPFRPLRYAGKYVNAKES